MCRDGRVQVHVHSWRFDGDDEAVIILNDLTVEALKRNNLKPVTPDNWQSPPDDFDEYFLIGTPKDLVAFRGTVPDIINVGAVLLPVTPTDDPPESLRKPYPRFYGTVSLPTGDDDHPPVTTIKGMSGGPIFGVKKVDKRRAYWFFAIQSGWDEGTRTIAACPFKPFADHIVEILDRVLDS